MGLFSTVLHIYNTNQADTVKELINELRESYTLTYFAKLDIDNTNLEKVTSESVFSNSGVFYLITEQKNNWTTILELNVNIDPSFYLYELTSNLSKRLDAFVLSLHLHDDDVIFYNLEKQGNALDGYSSNYQYFLTEPADKEEILSQRHSPNAFLELLPPFKTIDKFNSILNEGYWDAFDNDNLDEDGVPHDDKYFIDEEDRFTRIGNYLELFGKDDYPFADWYSNLSKLDLINCYLLKADK